MAIRSSADSGPCPRLTSMCPPTRSVPQPAGVAPVSRPAHLCPLATGLPSFEDLAYLFEESARGQRLLEERDLCVEHAVAHDHNVRIARHEERLEVGSDRTQPLDELSAAHLGHHHVGQEQIDR